MCVYSSPRKNQLLKYTSPDSENATIGFYAKFGSRKTQFLKTDFWIKSDKSDLQKNLNAITFWFRNQCKSFFYLTGRHYRCHQAGGSRVHSCRWIASNNKMIHMIALVVCFCFEFAKKWSTNFSQKNFVQQFWKHNILTNHIRDVSAEFGLFARERNVWWHVWCAYQTKQFH